MRKKISDRSFSSAELIASIEQKTGYRFKKIRFLEDALTHPSSSKAGSSSHAYERLEFLGDRVLGLVVADMIFQDFPTISEGEMSLRFNHLVNASTLSEIAEKIDLSIFLRLDSISSLAGKKGINVRADSLESFIAAIYLDGGLEAVRIFIRSFWQEKAEKMNPCRRDPKTELQEWMHQKSLGNPVYTIYDRQGPDHNPLFTISLCVENFQIAFGKGTTRREAEQDSAREFLFREGIWSKEH